MELKNKKTGEIATLLKQYDNDNTIEVLGNSAYVYHSLAGLNEDWEDAPEEPKGIVDVDVLGANDGRVVIIKCGSEEEAELLVQKVKAWIRLKDNGFKFNGYTGYGLGEIKFEHDVMGGTELEQDLDLLFGGEDEDRR